MTVLFSDDSNDAPSKGHGAPHPKPLVRGLSRRHNSSSRSLVKFDSGTSLEGGGSQRSAGREKTRDRLRKAAGSTKNLLGKLGRSFRGLPALEQEAKPASGKQAEAEQAKKLVAKLSRKALEALVLQKVATGAAITLGDLGDGAKAAGSAFFGGAESAAVTASEGRSGRKSLLPAKLQQRLTSAEEDEVVADFEEFDAKKEGPATATISLDGYIKVMMRLESDCEEMELIARFQEMDLDGKGYVTFVDFATAWADERDDDGA